MCICTFQAEARWKPSYLARRSSPSDFDAAKSEELMGEILNDVEEILNDWKVSGGPKNYEALWLRNVLGNLLTHNICLNLQTGAG